jgi:hypothetical protein
MRASRRNDFPTAACGGLRSAPDCRPRRTSLHLSHSCATPFGPAILMTQDPSRTCAFPGLIAGIEAQTLRGPTPGGKAMRRRRFLTIVGGSTAWPLRASAQPVTKFYLPALKSASPTLGIEVIAATVKEQSISKPYRNSRMRRAPVIVMPDPQRPANFVLSFAVPSDSFVTASVRPVFLSAAMHPNRRSAR